MQHVSIKLVCLLTIQYAATAQSTDQDFQPVDQAVEDTGPLSTTLRDIQTDLREPVGFDRVYRVPGENEKLMRVNGSVHAVFPQSTYVPTRFGLLPLIPPDTVFFIGQPQADSVDTNAEESPFRIQPLATGSMLLGARLDNELDAMLYEPTQQVHERTRHLHFTPGSQPTIVTDDSYRSQRIRELLHQAASTHKGESHSTF